MTNTLNTDVPLEVQCHRMVAKKENYHFTAPADKEINSKMLQPATSVNIFTNLYKLLILANSKLHF